MMGPRGRGGGTLRLLLSMLDGRPASGIDHDPEVTASMSTPLELEPGSTSAQPESVLQGEKIIEGRSLGQIAWIRLKRDKVALAGGFFVVYLVVVAFAATLVVGLLGHPPNEFHQELIDPNTQVPIGPYGGMSWDFLFGLEPVNGRDIFSRVVYGSQVSLLIAFLATLLSVVIGTVLGVVAAFFGGAIDTIVSRTMDVFLAFPLLVFALALAGVVPDEAFGLKGDALRISVIVFIIGFFNWPYIGRIVRGQTLSLREREFVDAARSLGARTPPAASGRAPPTSSSRSCCRTSWRRSSSTRPCSSRATSSSRRACPSS